MANYISEDDIEQAILSKLKKAPYKYDVIICDASPDKKDDLNDGTNRISKKECILPSVLMESLKRLNPNIEQSVLDDILKDLRRDYSSTDLVYTNYSLYNKIRNYIKVNVKKNKKEDDFDYVKLIDFDTPVNNIFTAVSQMWIQGKYNYRRPDILIFVNGLPLVFIELKNSIRKVEEGYNNNLKSYLKDIPNLFAFNQICVISNGLETRLGAFNATYDFFFEWLKVESEKEKTNRKEISEKGISIECFIKGLLNKERLIDYIENFILFDNKQSKIIAKNHQYLGVNNLIESLKNRKDHKGKLGVFWHTQGSGKSYSMIMFERKVNRKFNGNFTFLVITDREDLDTQIHKNFVRTEVIGNKEECQPKDSKQLREFLTTNKPIIFTLIHKFRYDKDEKFPVLSTRDDIIVMVDEAHRTQYKDLAENMRTALPNANFIAFTGTPLLGSRRLTNQWFGKYVSEYNFSQSIDDGSTVPLFYSRRVPEVGLTNKYLDNDIVDIIQKENLTDDERTRLENSTSKILEVIKRDDRLDKIARDIAHHFPRRGFLGKGMVISVDKFTAVKMYDKVSFYLEEEKRELTKERDECKDKSKIDEVTKILKYLDSMKMAVVISEENDEERKFTKYGLDITKHRKKMNEPDINGNDIEDQFKDPDNSLQLVFVCAMWLTGFDVKSLSTLYLDKPMKSHTLMQAIARTNRIFPNKTCGLIIDYVNVFSYMQDALGDYAIGDNKDIMPVKDIDKLIDTLDECISQTNEYLKSINIDIDKVIAEKDKCEKLRILSDFYNSIIGTKENAKERFKIMTNTMINLYEASKPEIFERKWKNEKFSPIEYLHKLFYNQISDRKIEEARFELAKKLDSSISVTTDSINTIIHKNEEIDLSEIDLTNLAKKINNSPYKSVEINDLKKFIEDMLKRMINKNCTRIKFSQRFENIVSKYNAEGSNNQVIIDQLLKLLEDLSTEQKRAVKNGLTEEELEVYDLLTNGKNLNKKEKQKVISSAKNLFKKLKEERNKLFVVDWYADEQQKTNVKRTINDVLNSTLPDSYGKVIFNLKLNLILSLFIDKAVQGVAIV